MTIYVFLGPTLSVEEARTELDAVYLPPVSQGDVYRVTISEPRAIGIIDGYFNQVPAVWHKEVLYAMAAGIHVYGSASMGALRAAELAAFGMQGVGRIFEDFHSGALEDDDEVAVLHGDAESGYRSMSEAMVNIRPTLARAAKEGALSASSHAALLDLAKRWYYPERSYAELLRRAHEVGVSEAEVSALRDFLPRGRIDQKREDALEMLRRMRAEITPEQRPKQVSYRLEHTKFWDDLLHFAGGAGRDASGAAAMLRSDAVLDELRLQGAGYLNVQAEALLRNLAMHAAEHMGLGKDEASLELEVADFRKKRGLDSDAQLGEWVEENQLSPTQFQTLMRQETVFSRVRAAAEMRSRGHLLNHLRLTGRYAELRARAADKRRRLEQAGLWNADFEHAGITRDELLTWYFDRVGPFVPAAVLHHVRTFDYFDPGDLLRTVLREYCYQRLIDGELR